MPVWFALAWDVCVPGQDDRTQLPDVVSGAVHVRRGQDSGSHLIRLRGQLRALVTVEGPVAGRRLLRWMKNR
jgi:hypothetical protein